MKHPTTPPTPPGERPFGWFATPMIGLTALGSLPGWLTHDLLLGLMGSGPGFSPFFALLFPWAAPLLTLLHAFLLHKWDKTVASGEARKDSLLDGAAALWRLFWALAPMAALALLLLRTLPMHDPLVSSLIRVALLVDAVLVVRHYWRGAARAARWRRARRLAVGVTALGGWGAILFGGVLLSFPGEWIRTITPEPVRRLQILGEAARPSFFHLTLPGRTLNPGHLLTEVPLQGANFSGAVLVGLRFDRADLTEALFTGADLQEASLETAQLTNATFENANLRGASLAGAGLADASFIGADLTGADLRGADLRGAILRWATLDETRLEGANLEGAWTP